MYPLKKVDVLKPNFCTSTEVEGEARDVFTGGDCFQAIVADSFHILVVVSYFFFSLATSHHYYADYSFLFFIKSTRHLADVVVNLDGASGSLAACTPSPLRAVSCSSRSSQDQGFQVLVRSLEEIYWFFFVLP